MLSPKREAFCLAYAECGNATQAYKRAGYKVKSDNVAKSNASRLLTYADVQSRLQEIQAKIESEKIMGPEEMQERLTAIARQTARSPDDKPPDYKDALQAMNLLGKMQGSFMQRQEIDVHGVVPVVLHDDIGSDGGD